MLVAVEYHKRFDPIYTDAKDRIRTLGGFSFFTATMTQVMQPTIIALHSLRMRLLVRDVRAAACYPWCSRARYTRGGDAVQDSTGHLSWVSGRVNLPTPP